MALLIQCSVCADDIERISAALKTGVEFVELPQTRNHLQAGRCVCMQYMFRRLEQASVFEENLICRWTDWACDGHDWGLPYQSVFLEMPNDVRSCDVTSVLAPLSDSVACGVIT